MAAEQLELFPAGCCPRIHEEVAELRALVEELVEDSRKARPLLDRYLKLTNPSWMRKGRA